MPHYPRAAVEGRTLIQSALASAADLEVSETELRVRVAPLSSPHRTRVLAALCGALNATAATFPGTKLLLRYEVAEMAARWSPGAGNHGAAGRTCGPSCLRCACRRRHHGSFRRSPVGADEDSAEKPLPRRSVLGQTPHRGS